MSRQLDELAAFCRFWRMPPSEAMALDPLVYEAFVKYQNREVRANQRAVSRAKRGR